jgi:hypothetical protein
MRAASSWRTAPPPPSHAPRKMRSCRSSLYATVWQLVVSERHRTRPGVTCPTLCNAKRVAWLLQSHARRLGSRDTARMPHHAAPAVLCTGSGLCCVVLCCVVLCCVVYLLRFVGNAALSAGGLSIQAPSLGATVTNCRCESLPCLCRPFLDPARMTHAPLGSSSVAVAAAASDGRCEVPPCCALCPVPSQTAFWATQPAPRPTPLRRSRAAAAASAAAAARAWMWRLMWSSAVGSALAAARHHRPAPPQRHSLGPRVRFGTPSLPSPPPLQAAPFPATRRSTAAGCGRPRSAAPPPTARAATPSCGARRCATTQPARAAAVRRARAQSARHVRWRTLLYCGTVQWYSTVVLLYRWRGRAPALAPLPTAAAARGLPKRHP